VARKMSPQSQQMPPAVQTGSAPQLKIHQISEDELVQLENGPAGQVHLSFALALLPAALTILITLQTVEIVSNRIYSTYLIFLILFACQGLYHLIRWWSTGKSLKGLVKEIRNRMPEKPGIPQQIIEDNPPGQERQPTE